VLASFHRAGFPAASAIGRLQRGAARVRFA